MRETNMDDNIDSELDKTRSIEIPKDADLGLRKKFRSIKRKRRREFHGRQELGDEKRRNC